MMEEVTITIDDTDDDKFAKQLENDIQVILENAIVKQVEEPSILEWYSTYNGSDSPISMSSNNSDDEEEWYQSPKEKNRAIEKQLLETYSATNRHSNELDIIITFLKGQRYLYMYANHITRIRLNILTMTSILFTASIAIFAPFVGTYEWSTGLIVVLNALTTMMISIMNHLKLEASAEMYYSIAMQYDKLETNVEFKNNMILFLDSEEEKKKIIMGKMTEVENELIKIKEANLFAIPEEVKSEFPLIVHMNVFSMIKKIESVKYSLVEQFIDAKNESKYILQKYPFAKENSREKKRLQYLAEAKESMKETIGHCKNSYAYIDDLITREMNAIDARKKRWIWYKKTAGVRNKDYVNPVVDEYLKFIMNES
jgi:hypothetical protein